MAKIRVGGKLTSFSNRSYTMLKNMQSQNGGTLAQNLNYSVFGKPKNNVQNNNQNQNNAINSNTPSVDITQMVQDYNTLSSQSKHSLDSGFLNGQGIAIGNYDDGGNPNLIAFQGTHNQAVTTYLNSLARQRTPSVDAEGYSYHQSKFQNMVIDLDLNKPVYAKLNAKDFDNYCKQTNQQSFARGWNGGQSSKDRFENAIASHTGTGMYGDGYYFGDKSTARAYGSTLTEACFSPNARVVTVDYLRKLIKNSPHRRAYENSGRNPTSRYSSNVGEAQMALKMGYNVIQTSWNYVVLTRDALIIKE